MAEHETGRPKCAGMLLQERGAYLSALPFRRTWTRHPETGNRACFR